jgi:hypothetical protein
MKRLATLAAAVAALTTAAAQSPYITRVFDYCPAPGQFINSLPEYEAGDNAEDLRRKAEACIAHDAQELISLGGFGGYVTFAFDHLVENVSGHYDFRILANAFYANANPNPDAPAEGGSCEPGIVLVAIDENGNGFPDDEWYELAGSEYFSESTIHDYRITYFRPNSGHVPDPDPDYIYISDRTYIRWIDGQGEKGYIPRNVYHDQSYFPLWINANFLTFSGTLLPDNYVDESGHGKYYVQYAYPWGYVDNHPNTDPRSCFNIDWAVDADGNPVHLDAIDFIRVQNAINQDCGWLGETSTEVGGAIDLHISGEIIPCPYTHFPEQNPPPPDAFLPAPELIPQSAPFYYTPTGRPLGNALPQRPGLYILRLTHPTGAAVTRKVIVN